ncbi:hypothetical protein [Halorubrum trueperi]|uniref:Uncharacterized protein n=1 Tax=Halorubrum trueperi TaxID=2004704 RepID=A0ABD5UEF7_9EURY
MGAKDPAMFDCPECGVTAPAASIPYDALGYAVCPVCAHSTTPRTPAGPVESRRSTRAD